MVHCIIIALIMHFNGSAKTIKTCYIPFLMMWPPSHIIPHRKEKNKNFKCSVSFFSPLFCGFPLRKQMVSPH